MVCTAIPPNQAQNGYFPLRLAARHLPGALLARLVDVLPEALQLGLVDHGADHRSVIVRIPDFQATDPVGEAVDEFVMDLRVHDEAVRGHADLARGSWRG
jgi:hypothetical protein